jgi:phosphoglycerate dehydrogenase-like enzyme
MLAKAHSDAIEVKFVDSGQPEDSVVSQAKDSVAVISAGVKTFTTNLIKKLPRLKLVQVTSAGTDWIDKAALGELGIRVANNGGGNAPAVAEHTIALMFSVYRKFEQQMASARAKRWAADISGEPEEFHTLVGKTVGIIGLGRIGSRVAARLAGWECELIYHDIVHISPERERQLKVTRVPLDELLKRSDVVTLHVPLERTTYPMIGERELDLMKPTAVLINACRGPVVDEKALVEALKEKKIFGAGLDVVEVEPTPSDNPLFDIPNVVITPHTASRPRTGTRRFVFDSPRT